MDKTKQVLDRLEDIGVHLRLNGDRLTAYPKEAVTEEAADLIRAYKDRLIELVRVLRPADERRRSVLALLETGRRLAMVVPDLDTDPVIGTVALRKGPSVITFDVEMPKAKFDPIKLLELVHRWAEGAPTPEITRELAVVNGSKRDSKPARPAKSLDPEPEAA